MDQETAADDLETLLAALEEARADVQRLTEEDTDLRESAGIWIRLYDANLRRANRAEAELKRLRSDLPIGVQHLYDALDRVAVLKEAISTVVDSCETCARSAQAGVPVAERTPGTCTRCLNALEALRSAAAVAGSKP